MKITILFVILELTRELNKQWTIKDIFNVMLRYY